MPRVHPLCRTSRIEKGASCPRSQWRHGGLAMCHPTWMRAGTADDVSHEERGPRCWRRARSLAFLVAFAFAFLPGRGEAQYYAANISPAPYPALPLPNGQQMTVHGSGVIQGFGYHPTFFDIELPFPVFSRSSLPLPRRPLTNGRGRSEWRTRTAVKGRWCSSTAPRPARTTIFPPITWCASPPVRRCASKGWRRSAPATRVVPSPCVTRWRTSAPSPPKALRSSIG